MNPKEVLTLSLKATIHIYQSYFIGGEEIKLVTYDSDNKTVGHGPVFYYLISRFGARLTRVAADKTEKSPGTAPQSSCRHCPTCTLSKTIHHHCSSD